MLGLGILYDYEMEGLLVDRYSGVIWTSYTIQHTKL
jgi:hypothetical protein